jgi:hypothetical protein
MPLPPHEDRSALADDCRTFLHLGLVVDTGPSLASFIRTTRWLIMPLSCFAGLVLQMFPHGILAYSQEKPAPARTPARA